ncbi:acyl-CoA thioesterase [Magnetovibrio sp. PR-2]|uniref:acyl-CoA thioesterase n=1 Tax=Magnetovibrio sp. PR-2 TaxID=3120356 RepID=UPI002FCE00C4
MTESTVSSSEQPRGELAIRQVAMPANLNSGGNVFGGWILAQMDLAGGITANDHAQGRVATVAITAMEFHLPVLSGDVLCCYADVTDKGNTSLTIHVQAWVHRRTGSKLEQLKVTEGDFVFVALNEDGSKRQVPKP